MSISLNSNDINSSASLATAINRNYYPNGQAVVVTTSRNQEGIYGDTLTSRTLTEVLSGDAFYQDPRYSIAANNMAANSSLNSLISGGAQAAFFADAKAVAEGQELEVKNGDSTVTVSGMAAFQQALSNTNVISRNLGGTAATNAISTIANSAGLPYNQMIQSAETVSVSSGSKGPPGTGSDQNHAAIDYITDTAAFTAGSRTVVIRNTTIDDQEFSWLQERLDVLHQYAVNGMVADNSGIKNGFSFDLSNELDTLFSTRSFYPDSAGSTTTTVEKSIIDLPMTTAYLCPTLIEFLIYMASDNCPVRISGGIGFGRAANTNIQGPNLSPAQNRDSISDHVFGRAFDIGVVSSSDGSSIVNLESEGGNIDRHREALYMLLEALDNMALQTPYLLPDLIVCSPDLNSELGIIDGLEPDNAPVKIRYRNLRYVNFYSDSNHRSHIHVSWSAARSGRYAGPGGALSVPTFEWIDGSSSIPGGTWSNLMSELSAEAPISEESLAKFRMSYATGEDPGVLTNIELFDLLRSTVFSAEAAAIFCAVVMRESGGTVRLINPITSGGDWSVGLFQINLRIGANGRHDFFLPEGGVTRKGWQLGYANYAAEGITEDNFNAKTTALYEQYGSQDRSPYYPLLDPLLWIPINQAAMCYTVAKGGGVPPANMTPSDKLGYSPETGYIFFPWGDYNGGPPYGFISNVHFKTAVETYQSTGLPASNLRDWTLQMFNTSGSGSVSAPYAENWVNGWVYRSPWSSGGWIDNGGSQEDTIDYTFNFSG